MKPFDQVGSPRIERPVAGKMIWCPERALAAIFSEKIAEGM